MTAPHLPPFPPFSRRGFSVIELLIVIAVIACLLFLIMGAVSRTRQVADSAACAENLRQIGVGIQLYAADHSGVYPPCFEGTGGQSDSYWNYLIAPYMGYPRDNGIGVDVVRCRAATRETNTSCTYGANYPMMLSLDYNQIGVWWLDIGLRRLSTHPKGYPFLVADATTAPIYSPVKWPLNVDRDSDGVNDSNGSFEFNRVKFRHQGTANFLRVDGSVVRLKSIDWAQNRDNLWGTP